MKDLEALAALTHIPYLGSVKIRSLIRRFGSASDALKAKTSEIGELYGFGTKSLAAWELGRENEAWKRDLELAEKEGIQIIPYSSPKYPRQLLQIPDFPLLLYVKGQLDVLNLAFSVAVIGTRQASSTGWEIAETLGTELAAAGCIVVSGLAKGIDTAAHWGALKAGRTLAVLGSGLLDVYPRENVALARKIAMGGAIVSEFPLKTPPEKQNFPMRNRIVSGLSKAVVLVEAPLESGAMHTIRKAGSHGKKIFAIPPFSKGENVEGNHLLLKEGHALPVKTAEDIMKHLRQTTEQLSFF